MLTLVQQHALDGFAKSLVALADDSLARWVTSRDGQWAAAADPVVDELDHPPCF